MIFVTADGRVKILDFGLAKLAEVPSALSGSMLPTRSVGTAAGLVLGTVGYMAPEQVRGQHVDQRADIFAFGSVLYEVLTGERAFQGDTPADTLSAILKDDPPQLASGTSKIPAALQRVVQRCLEKKPELRFHSAHDLAYAIEVAASTSSSGAIPLSEPAGARGPGWLMWAGVGLAAVVGLAALAWQTMSRTIAPVPVRVVRLVVTLPEGTATAQDSAQFEVSPNGEQIAMILRTASTRRSGFVASTRSRCTQWLGPRARRARRSGPPTLARLRFRRAAV